MMTKEISMASAIVALLLGLDSILTLKNIVLFLLLTALARLSVKHYGALAPSLTEPVQSPYKMDMWLKSRGLTKCCVWEIGLIG